MSIHVQLKIKDKDEYVKIDFISGNHLLENHNKRKNYWIEQALEILKKRNQNYDIDVKESIVIKK